MSFEKLLSVCLLFVGVVNAGLFEENSLEEQEAKTFFTSGGTYYLTLNTTYVIIAGLILGALAFAALFLKTFLATLTRPSTSSYSSYPSSYYHKQHYKRRRYQRSEDSGMKVDLLFSSTFDNFPKFVIYLHIFCPTIYQRNYNKVLQVGKDKWSND